MGSLESAQEMNVSDHAPEQKASEFEKQEDPDTYPEGGLEAWLVVFGATVAVGCTLGYVNAFGYVLYMVYWQCTGPTTNTPGRVFESYYLQHQLSHKSASSIAWIGGLQVFFQFFTSLVAGALFDKIGARVRRRPSPEEKRLLD